MGLLYSERSVFQSWFRNKMLIKLRHTVWIKFIIFDIILANKFGVGQVWINRFLTFLKSIFFGLFKKTWLSKMIFLAPRNFFTWTLILKIAVKMNLRIITKNHAADPEIGFLTKSFSKPHGCATTMPTAWKLRASKWSKI